MLHLQRRPVDGAAVEARRRAGLQPAQRQPEPGEASATGRAPAARRPGRPACVVSPMWMTPRRKVPVVSTTAPAPIVRAAGRDHASQPPAVIDGQVLDHARPASSGPAGRAAAPASPRGRAAGRPGRAGPAPPAPCVRLSTRNWMPAASMARPMTPSSASISRTSWPLPRPPIAGLHDISPMRVAIVGEQQGPRAQPRGRRRRLAAGMAAADHDHVISLHRSPAVRRTCFT